MRYVCQCVYALQTIEKEKEGKDDKGETASEPQSSDNASSNPADAGSPRIQTSVMTIGEALEKLATPSEGGDSNENNANIKVIMIDDSDANQADKLSVISNEANAESISKGVLNEIYLLNNLNVKVADSKDSVNSIQLIAKESEPVDASVLAEHSKGMAHVCWYTPRELVVCCR